MWPNNLIYEAIFEMQIQSKADKKIYDMIDVLREGNMRWESTCVYQFRWGLVIMQISLLEQKTS